MELAARSSREGGPLSNRVVAGVLVMLGPLGPTHLYGQGATAGDADSLKIPLSAAIRRAHAAGTRDSTGRPGPNYWQLWTEYTIDARLDETTSMVIGRETVSLHNTSPFSLKAIQLRLDQNRFRPRTPADRSVPHPTDGMIVTRVVVNGEEAAIGPGVTITGPVLSGTQGTSERLSLAQPVTPDEKLQFEIEWHFEVPLDDESSAFRLGRWGTYLYQVAQWYPRVAMFDDLNGWDLSTYDGNTEFYNPYGRFDVRLDVPAGWLVGATGILQNPEQVLTARTRNRLAQALTTDSTITVVGLDEGGAGMATLPGDRLIWHFVADSVRDFAWGTSRQYAWKATRVDIPGRRPISIHFLYTSRHADQFATAAAIVRHDLAFNSSLIMPYAYPQHTLLDGPEGAMEYPMLTMSDGTALAHEVWHQWWPIMVGSNETWYSFMDEGFAGFLGGLTVSSRMGSVPTYGDATPRSLPVPLIWPDDRGPPDLMAASYGYGRPRRMFAALGNMVGHVAVVRALSGYAKAWRFKHPSPWDLMFYMNQALDRDLSAFWYKWIFATQ
jgi:hypothetical protein